MTIFDIAKEAGREFDVSELGTPCLTKYAEKIVAEVKLNPGSIDEFESQFVEMWNTPGEVPFELISLCMYHLRLEGFRAYIESYRRERLAESDWRAESPTRSVLSAYDDPWKEHDLFYE